LKSVLAEKQVHKKSQSSYGSFHFWIKYAGNHVILR